MSPWTINVLSQELYTYDSKHTCGLLISNACKTEIAEHYGISRSSAYRLYAENGQKDA